MKTNIAHCLPLLVLYGLLLFCGQTLASEPRAELKKLQEILPQTCQFSGEFTQQKQLKDIPAPLISRGNFLFSCQRGLIWKQTQPFNEALLYTKHNINFAISQDQVKPLKGSIHHALSKILMGLMRGDLDYIEKNFSVHPHDQSRANHFLLKPINKKMQKAIEHIVLWKTEASGTVHYQINDSRQQQTQVSIENLQALDEQQYPDVIAACVGLLDFSKNTCDALRYPMRYQ